MNILENNVTRKDALAKVTGQAKYTADNYSNNMLYARLVTSTISHGKILSIDTSEAQKVEGVKSIITGQNEPVLCGVLLKDRPAIAIDKVRYYGKPLAIIVATTEAIAENATKLIKIKYEKLPSVSFPTNALLPNSPIIHENPLKYIALVDDVKPIGGTIIYKEAVLPLLLADADVTFYSINGNKTININEAFNKRIKLNPGEFIGNFSINTKFLNTKYFHIKHTANEKIDYPLITVCAIIFDQKIRIAFSGLCNFPFRSFEIENTLNNTSLSKKEKLDMILSQIPGKVLDNLDGSARYRLFVLRNTVNKILEELV